MSQPPRYQRTKDFGADDPDQTDNQAINNEFDAVARTTDGLRSNLAKIQRDDGGLKDGLVTKDALAQALKEDLYTEFSGNVSASVVAAQQAAGDANIAAIAAQDAATAAAASQASAASSMVAAGNSAADAAVAAASVSLPSIVGKSQNFLRVKADESGYELRASAQVRADISAVGLAGDEIVEGEKEFTVRPIVGTAMPGTNDDGAASTAYIDTAVNASREVRQTVLQGVINSSGYASMLSAGSGRALNLSAAAMPMRTAFAQGAADYIATLSADATGVVSGLAASNLSYIYQDYVGPTSVAWGATLAPVQYGYSYNQAAQALLQFGGSAGSNVFLDDFGNTWVIGGAAKIQSNQVKFGSGALGGSGASNSLNGTNESIYTSNIKTLGNGGWTLRCWFYALTNATNQTVINAGVASNYYGIAARLGTAGKMLYNLSSTGSTDDISGGSTATGALTVSTNTWNYLEITYDPVAGKYFCYINGALDYSVASGLKICPIDRVSLAVLSGIGQYLSGYIDKFEFLPYCANPNGTGYSVPVAAPNITAVGYASDFFSIPNMTMYQVTAPSTAAGVNPTFTAKKRVYVGEAVASASAVSSVVNYASNGGYVSIDTYPLPAAGLTISKAHNIGTAIGVRVSIEAECMAAEHGFSVGDIIAEGLCGGGSSSNYPLSPAKTRNNITFTTGNAAAFAAVSKTSGNAFGLASANWKYRVIAKRGW
ncbi:LamG-like jellyroll fold domain-containing protein [Herbaspirillum chlorophenolicum]|uniref:LamG-like jellyroll fold domain-containing protein n=1 Tax=Herbaspirillum chlorophenolicum TaxID=211589 RepID=UPI00067BA804|nr:LamG-like jellyroll fold domain-containing protein [Herbaspirillum chlorophenolicum]